MPAALIQVITFRFVPSFRGTLHTYNGRKARLGNTDKDGAVSKTRLAGFVAYNTTRGRALTAPGLLAVKEYLY